jgi:hypothetical protein
MLWRYGTAARNTHLGGGGNPRAWLGRERAGGAASRPGQSPPPLCRALRRLRAYAPATLGAAQGAASGRGGGAVKPPPLGMKRATRWSAPLADARAARSKCAALAAGKAVGRNRPRSTRSRQAHRGEGECKGAGQRALNGQCKTTTNARQRRGGRVQLAGWQGNKSRGASQGAGPGALRGGSAPPSCAHT